MWKIEQLNIYRTINFRGIIRGRFMGTVSQHKRGFYKVIIQEVIFQGVIMPVGNSPEGNPIGGNFLGGNLPTGKFLGLYFLGGRYYTGGNTLGEKSSRRQSTGGQFSRGEHFQRAILWEAVFKKLLGGQFSTEKLTQGAVY